MAKKIARKPVKKMASTEKADDKRRELLAAAGKLAAVMAVLGVSGKRMLGTTGPAATTERDKAVQALFQYAIRTGDMEAAIKKYGEKAQVKEKHVKALLSLTKDDLELLRQIQDKLAVAGGSIAQVW